MMDQMISREMTINENWGSQCCFCKKSIEGNAVDPLDISVVFNEDVKKKTGSFQTFYAHFSCLKERLHKDNQGYLIREDKDDE